MVQRSVMKIVHLVLILSLSYKVIGQSYELVPLQTVTDASLRGLSVVDDVVVWASGSKGTVIRSVDGGKTWEKRNPTGHNALDFRSLYAFNADEAIIANAGSPAYVLRTTDGGQQWTLVYSSQHPDIFLDGIDFWNLQDGLLYGDPIDGRMLMLRTRDGGRSWTIVTTAPMLEKGEASFAASGTGIRCTGKSDVMICTGGLVSRLWLSGDGGTSWRNVQPPVAMGNSSSGIFSAVLWDVSKITVVGGDFQEPAKSTINHFFSPDGGKTWKVPEKPVGGYRECVEFLGNKTLLAVGPAGSELSLDDGLTWSPLAVSPGIHVARKARDGRKVFAAGSAGLLLELVLH